MIMPLRHILACKEVTISIINNWIQMDGLTFARIEPLREGRNFNAVVGTLHYQSYFFFYVTVLDRHFLLLLPILQLNLPIGPRNREFVLEVVKSTVEFIMFVRAGARTSFIEPCLLVFMVVESGLLIS